MASTNPLTQITDGLWDMLEANTGFTALVKSGNRIKYDSRAPEKPAAQKADYPRVRIREYTGQCNLSRTSNSISFAKQYHIQVATGEQSYESIHDVEWEILRAFADWETTLEALKWNLDGKPFVKQCGLLSAQQALDDPGANRRIRGWSTVWIAEIECFFQNTTIKP